MNIPLQIAIDGPVGSGKSDIASRLAQKLGITYIYTGAMYRALTYYCLKHHIPLSHAKAVIAARNQITISLSPSLNANMYPTHIQINGEDVTKHVFTSGVGNVTPIVSAIAEVRKKMVDLQQLMAQGKSVVMEGRDIGYRVLPHAQMKIFLTASFNERARRIYEREKKKNQQAAFEEVKKETEERDRLDTSRTTDPLKKTSDAWELDTTGMNQDQVVKIIIQELQKRHLV